MRSWLLAAALLGAVAVLGVGFWILRPGGQPLIIDYYRIVDEDSIIVGTAGADGSETRVTAVVETADSVTVIVQRFDVTFGRRGGVTYPIELAVDLEQPLGDRAVFDPHHAVPLAP